MTYTVWGNIREDISIRLTSASQESTLSSTQVLLSSVSPTKTSICRAPYIWVQSIGTVANLSVSSTTLGKHIFFDYSDSS